MASREKEFELDLESGGTTSEDVTKVGSVSGSRQPKKLLSKVVSGVLNFDGRVDDESGVNSSGSSSNLGVLAEENVELLIDKSSGGEESREQLALMEKKCMKERCKRTNPRKPAKPPRPPRGPTLDAADQKFVREMSELAMKKRARIERMKALKKMKAAKSSSSDGSLSAMIITVLFFLIILFQEFRNGLLFAGIRSRSNLTVTFHGSPESAATTRGFVTVHYFSTPAANESHGPGSVSPSLVKQVSGSDSGDKQGKIT
ncbi:hypothetical protein RJ641_030758 [Dillenia turbinata]|uniref:Uncharacterized protein n=1 Tax=Dillenia turbinata TaxID=194707 RepID=A0AAN8VNE1_9MAGN